MLPPPPSVYDTLLRRYAAAAAATIIISLRFSAYFAFIDATPPRFITRHLMLPAAMPTQRHIKW